MLAVAAPSEDNWKHQSSSMSRPSIPSSSVTASVASTSPTSTRDSYNHSQGVLTHNLSNHNTNGNIVSPHSSQPNGVAQKPLVRSKSRGASMGGFVHGIVNGMQASLRNVGHKASHTVPASGYHSDHPPPSKAGLFKSRTSISPTRSDSPEGSVSEKTKEHPSPIKAFNKALARSQSRSRAYESEGDNHTIGSLRQSRPSFPTISTAERVSKANGHTHIPPSPLSRENSQVQPPPSAIATALGSSQEGRTSNPVTPITSSHSIRGPVSRSAAREILELDAIPPQDILKALAALLEQIATANDALRAERTARGEDPWDDQLSNVPRQGVNERDVASLSPESPKTPLSARSRSQQRAKSDNGSLNTPIWNQLTNASRVALSSRSSSLSFHARHIPQISLEAYLMRILKYCPTANSTFVAVLAYFDRMCLLADSIETERQAALKAFPPSDHFPPDSNSNAMDSTEPPTHWKRPPFAIDSYNVHRLVIAGVTVASKFFSDIFYTNSRYAKVGGLPQAELNQLELQFLLLNDFQLVVPPEELARYAAQLIKYAQGRGMNLKPENLGKGKLGREAKIVLGLIPEPEPEPIPTGPLSPGFMNGYDFPGRNHGPSFDRSRYPYGRVPMAYPSNDHFHASRLSGDGMDISHDSETEVSTDEDSTIKARSGSESEASEWGVGSTGEEGDGDGAETETEGEDEDDDGFHDRRNGRRLSSSSNGSHSRVGRLRGMPSTEMNRRQT